MPTLLWTRPVFRSPTCGILSSGDLGATRSRRRWSCPWFPSPTRKAFHGKQIWYSTHASSETRITIPYCAPKTGLDLEVGAYVEADPDFTNFFLCVAELVDLVLPRFVQEGKKYATITIGLYRGPLESVYLIEKLANHLTSRVAEDLARAGCQPQLSGICHPSGTGAGRRVGYFHDGSPGCATG